MKARRWRGPISLLLVGGVVVLVVSGLARGLWLANLHNGLLAAAFTAVGAYVLFQRPGHREGLLFQATGAVEAILFFGRQVGHTSSPGVDAWWGWLGVWPTAIGLALTTLSVICFPNGRLPSRRWRLPLLAVGVIALACTILSALWPVEYASTGTTTAPPFLLDGANHAATAWTLIAHPAYTLFQIVWLVAALARWRGSGRLVRLQLAWLAAAAGLSIVFLLVGLVFWGTPRAGVLAATLVPVAAGWAILHGQHVAAYSALSWLSRSGPEPQDMPTDVARAAAEALGAPQATLWIGLEDRLHAVGVWPERGHDIRPTSISALRDIPDLHVHTVHREATMIGAISVERARADGLSRAEQHLLDDLAAQAALVITHLDLAGIASRQRDTSWLQQLSRRERDVLELMAQGLSNAAIGQRLHLSIKTIEPVVSAIFTKLDLSPDATSNRRVLAVLAFLRPHVQRPDLRA